MYPKYNMNHKGIIGLLFLFFALVICSTGSVKYQGLRVDISALTLNRDILACIMPAMNRTLNHTFKSLSEHASLTSLYINDIKITKPIIEENMFEMETFSYNAPIYQLKSQPGSVRFELSFSYYETFLGFTIASGTGTGYVINMANRIYVFFNETHPDVQLPHPWDVDQIRLSWALFPPTQWIEEVLEKRFIHEFHQVVDDAMFDFAQKLLATYEYVEDVFEDDLDLVYRNRIMDVEATVDGTYMSIGFATNMTANGHLGHYVRKMYRWMEGSVAPLGDFSLCLSAELLPDSLDVLSRAGYHNMTMTPDVWGFANNTVSVLFEIMPALKEEYLGKEELMIDCKIPLKATINDITQRGAHDTYLQIQFPAFCVFKVEKKDKINEVLLVDVYTKISYKMNGEDESYKAEAIKSELYDFTETPKLPGNKRNILHIHVLTFSLLFSDGEMIGAGIKVVPNRRDQLKFVGFEPRKEEICFWYDEIN